MAHFAWVEQSYHSHLIPPNTTHNTFLSDAFQQVISLKHRLGAAALVPETFRCVY